MTPGQAAQAKLGHIDVVGAPKITERMIQAAGGRQGIFAALECDDSAEAIEFMRVYHEMPEAERDKFSVVELFLLAGMTARRFGEILMGSMMQQGTDVSRLLIAAAQPQVSEALIKAATERQPIYDRKGEQVGDAPPDLKAIEIFGKMSGMLPTPKGSQTIINMGQFNQAASEYEGATELEPMDDFLLDLGKITRNQLPAPAKTIDAPINASDISYKFSEV